jgi:hypothetical protein
MRSSCTYCATALAPINGANVFTLEVNCPAQAEQAGITEIDQPPPELSGLRRTLPYSVLLLRRAA